MHDAVVIGAGQSGLAVSRYLVQRGIEHIVLDANGAPGGAWQHAWPSLRLFSPGEASSLPGMLIPQLGEDYPSRAEVIDYLRSYEQRYALPVQRPVRVQQVRPARPSSALGFQLDVSSGPALTARTVVSATGTWSAPFVPYYPGRFSFTGRQIHSAQYAGPEEWRGLRVGVVGAANSAAQIAAELALDGEDIHLHWFTAHPPRWLADDVDGRDLFVRATQRLREQHGDMQDAEPSRTLHGDIVMVPPVREARDRGLLTAEPVFDRIVESGVERDGKIIGLDTLVWATGFRPALGHLAGWGIRPGEGAIRPLPGEESPWATRSAVHPGLFLVGYGDWTGAASATLVGVGRTARWTARAIERTLHDAHPPSV
ncbi:NAD(P)/FAD-dependent oxidoreductase [Corynebacterium uropygiale]|uniref:NAD(P)/FAD-dependent oxidoreductase n=1 Tax=Corynebacterium uropygiale TaxID=1775911 RepID=A0A9X1QTK4_9CORY|nr:NAD(P)-binding domain-containing protein [Corynebacterium uropygiale]MCF4006780.1 NAD(P)/FAD-dependent oxidoreductase [Corynebacterium uropygiale]